MGMHACIGRTQQLLVHYDPERGGGSIYRRGYVHGLKTTAVSRNVTYYTTPLFDVRVHPNSGTRARSLFLCINK
jgi:hypothetical protein